jgi:superfamily II DNA or RNA helicase
MLIRWRRHQREALDAIAAHDGDRHWVVLPPGGGKTLLGVATAERWGRPVVAFGPNAAIAMQWGREWERLTGEPASSDRSLGARFTALTYQSLAVFDGEADGGPPRSRLHPNGEALIHRLHDAGPITVILDECHHLLQAWGQLLDDVLAELDDAVVLALTATPPELLTPTENGLVDRLFGPVTYQATIPALVAEGDLVPFAELAWFTTPTAREQEWLAAHARRAAELISELTRPGAASTPLLTWAALLPIADLGEGLADAVVRLALAGHLAMPDEAHVTERHRRPPDLADWLLVAEGWLDALERDGDDADRATAARLTGLPPTVGYRRGRNGIRPGQDLVDRVLARSSAKARAAVEIAAHHLADDPDSRVLVLTEHATATALPADLDGVLNPASGSAHWVHAALRADERTAWGRPTVVTGADDRGFIAEATRALGAGEIRVLVGTRALLGEGWDCPQVTTVVDLTTATTSTAIVQTRGRALRTDPGRPGKVAVNWTVTSVADAPRGDADYLRLVAKHAGWFAVDGEGEIVDGVAHLDASLSPAAPPPTDRLSELNARAQLRAGELDAVRAAWGRVDPDLAAPAATLRLRGERLPAVATPAPSAPSPVTTLGVPSALFAGSLLAMPVLPEFGWIALVVAATVGLWFWLDRRRGQAEALMGEPSLTRYASAVADALRSAGHSPVGADAIAVDVTLDGEARVRLERVPEATSQLFAEALAELLGPIERPRYLVSRPSWAPRSATILDGVRAPRPDREVWHPVPAVFGASRPAADAFLACWHEHVGPGRAVFSGTPEGSGLVRALRWSSPLGDAAGLSIVQRRSWSRAKEDPDPREEPGP